MPQHSDTDVELTIAGVTENLQITVAYADWAVAGVTEPSQSAGKYHYLRTKILNHEGVAGIGPIIENDSMIGQEPRMISTPELVMAHKQGLQTALEKKLKKAYQARPLSLLVQAVAYGQMMSSEIFYSVVHSAFDAAKAAMRKEIHFNEIYVVDCDDGYFVRLSSVTDWEDSMRIGKV
jgi:hypothetical protein